MLSMLINIRMSHLISQILTPVADRLSDLVGTECSNTAKMARGIEDTDKVSRGMESRKVVISQDVKALYPNLDWVEVIRIIGKLLEETDITFNDVDYKNLGKYLAIHLTPEEISKNNLKSVIPDKVKPTKVGVAFLDTDIDANKEEKWAWKGKRNEPSILQKKENDSKNHGSSCFHPSGKPSVSI